jgi:hypothetical protein
VWQKTSDSPAESQSPVPRSLNLDVDFSAAAAPAIGVHVGLTIDLSDFEDMFLKAPDKRKKTAMSHDKDTDKSKRRKMNDAVNLLDRMRAQNILIALARIKLSFRGIRNVVLNMDDQALSLDSLLNILTLLPTFEEAKLLQNFKGDPNDLGEAEQFQMEMLTVPHISNRLQGLISIMQLPSKIKMVEGPLQHLCAACEELTKSTLFTQVHHRIRVVL